MEFPSGTLPPTMLLVQGYRMEYVLKCVGQHRFVRRMATERSSFAVSLHNNACAKVSCRICLRSATRRGTEMTYGDTERAVL
eukprot:2378158-Rhodomonas_salina.2